MAFVEILLKGFMGGLKSLPEVFKTLLKLPALLIFFIKALFRSKNWKCKTNRRNCKNEIDVPADVYKRADPLIYDQFYLMEKGLAVTWDNPDIQLYKAGIPISSSQLKPNEVYDLEVRVWNGSYDAPALGLPVFLSYLSFGVGTTSTFVGKTFVDLGAKATPTCPAYAKFKWKTPIEEGHYCLQAIIFWPDDANPDNNLGQENTQVGQLHSPAHFSFKVRNNKRTTRRFIYEIDDYTLPVLKKCAEQDNTSTKYRRSEENFSRLEESKRRWRKALSEQSYGSFSNIDGWNIFINPDKELLKPLDEILVQVSIEPKSGTFTGKKSFNVHTFSVNDNNERFFEGGVTLIVEK